MYVSPLIPCLHTHTCISLTHRPPPPHRRQTQKERKEGQDRLVEFLFRLPVWDNFSNECILSVISTIYHSRCSLTMDMMKHLHIPSRM